MQLAQLAATTMVVDALIVTFMLNSVWAVESCTSMQCSEEATQVDDDTLAQHSAFQMLQVEIQAGHLAMQNENAPARDKWNATAGTPASGEENATTGARGHSNGVLWMQTQPTYQGSDNGRLDAWVDHHLSGLQVLFLQGFKFMHKSPDQVYFRYALSTKPRGIGRSMHYTDFKSIQGGGITALAGHYIHCPRGKGLESWQLQMNSAGNQIRIKYHCISPVQPSPPAFCVDVHTTPKLVGQGGTLSIAGQELLCPRHSVMMAWRHELVGPSQQQQQLHAECCSAAPYTNPSTWWYQRKMGKPGELTSLEAKCKTDEALLGFTTDASNPKGGKCTQTYTCAPVPRCSVPRFSPEKWWKEIGPSMTPLSCNGDEVMMQWSREVAYGKRVHWQCCKPDMPLTSCVDAEVPATKVGPKNTLGVNMKVSCNKGYALQSWKFVEGSKVQYRCCTTTQNTQHQ